MRLRTTLVGLLVVVAVVLSGTIYYGFALHKDNITDSEREQVETTAGVVATDIESQLNVRVEVVELWATNDGLRGTDADRRGRALDSFVNRTMFQGGAVIAVNGTMMDIRSRALTPADRERLRGDNFGYRPYVQQALDGTTFISDPFVAETEERIVVVSTPIYRNGTIEGVLTGSLHLNNGSLFDNAASLGRSSHRTEITSGDQRLFSEEPAPGTEDDLVATARVEPTNWTVSVAQSRSEFAGQLREATGFQIGAVILALLSVGAVGVWISRSTISQLDELVDGLEDLKSGAYGRQLDLSAGDEWQEISDSFNALSDTLQQRESQLQVLNRVLRHNLRNDMNVVTAHAEGVLANPETPADVAESVEQIHATAERLINTSEHARALYEDLLSEGVKDPEPVDVTEIVARQVATLRTEFPQSTIQAEMADDAMALDTTVLPIVIEEVIHNALVHNDRPEDRRTVAVTVERHEDSVLSEHGEVRIVVTDNGPGIPMVEEALLTDELEETPVEHGSGLGVWLVNWLVDQLGGDVEAHTGIERGATVTIRVPAAPDEDEEDSDAADGDAADDEAGG